MGSSKASSLNTSSGRPMQSVEVDELSFVACGSIERNKPGTEIRVSFLCRCFGHDFTGKRKIQPPCFPDGSCLPLVFLEDQQAAVEGQKWLNIL